ncbi:MAG: hypothetical protein SWH68_10975 [Thermodesulfobacteriota bacterium]|nr:hypothetical protein [Thermodesulfobacteriota bacterium]
MKKWRCKVCDYIHEDEEPPEKCPVCGADKSKFEAVSDQEAETIQAAKTAKQLAREKKMLEKSGVTAETQPGTSTDAAQKTGGIEQSTHSAGLFGTVNDLMVRHHAHPVSVHFPNGVLPVSVLFVLLTFVISQGALGRAALYNNLLVLLSLPVVLYSGANAWQRKYGGRLTPVFRNKIIAASVTTVSCLLVVIWCLAQPDILETGTGLQKTGFVLLNLIMVAATGVAGFIGGKLVFKD